jgi:nitroreductase
MEFDLAMTDALLATTRSVRRRLDFTRPVPREVIMECLELAVQAPTGGNYQGWRWVVVDDPAKRAALAELYRKPGRTYLVEAMEAAAARGDQQTERVYASALWLADHFEEAPVFVIPCIADFPPPGSPPAAVASAYGSIYPAVWSFQLALRTRGLGTAMTTLHILNEQEAAKLLGIPDGVHQVALMPIAYTKGTDFKRAARPPVATVTHWNAW